MKPVSVPVSFVAVAVSRLSLKLAGFRRTIRWARRLAGQTEASNDWNCAERSARSVAIAAAFFPGRAICLEQSVALYVLLRRRGVAVSLRIGVQPYPFQAHAWIELDGRPVFENADELVKFVAFPEGLAV